MKLGYDEAGKGPVLLLVHGFPLNREIWRYQLEGLADLRRVVAVDLRGRGKSPAPTDGGWTIETHAGDLEETIQGLGAGPVDLAGISMGGYVAFAFIRRHAELVRSLILVSTRATPDPPEYRKGREMTAERARLHGTGALAGSMLPNLLAEDAPQPIRLAVMRIFDSVPGSTTAADSLAMRDRADSTGLLPGIAVPTLVVEGAGEQLLPAGSAQSLADAIPGARLASIPAGGHFVPIENAPGFNRAVRDFLEGR